MVLCKACSELCEGLGLASFPLCHKHMAYLYVLTEWFPCAGDQGIVVKKIAVFPALAEIMLKLSKQVFSPKGSV